MRPRTSVLLLQFGLLAACGEVAARPEVRDPAAVLRLATWNVHDLFDEVDRTLPPGDLDGTPSPTEVEARLDLIAEVLTVVDADAVLLQEVEDLPLLRRLAERAGYREARLLEGNDPRGIDVGLLSRLPVLSYRGHAGERAGDGRLLWPRDAVEALLDAGGRQVLLVGTHLSSHLSDPGGARRHEQSARLRAIADEGVARWAPALAVVGGDLNDEASSPALQPLLGDGAWGDADGGFGPEDWTWSSGADRSRLDHLALRATDAGAWLSATVQGGPEVAASSDHRPVVLDLLLP
jgi:endonuclease/exonuclease/phosphatase family metal-dependent hydrolase